MGFENKVWYLERALFEFFPEKDIEDWDNCGVIVGNKEAVVEGVAIALDPSLKAIDQAAELGCNLLLTHHPVYLKPPYNVIVNGPGTWSTKGSMRDTVEQAVAGVAIHRAIEKGISLMAMHTNLDYSSRVQHVLPDVLGLTYLNPVEQTSQEGGVGSGEIRGGLGQLSSTHMITLLELAERCKNVFGVPSRVWGDPEQKIELVATCPGSAWPLINDATRCEFDCFICGESRYHTTKAACQSGISVIELGHDVSERLFIDVLYDAVIETGQQADTVHKLAAEENWWTA